MLAAALVHIRRAFAQVFVRSVWWLTLSILWLVGVCAEAGDASLTRTLLLCSIAPPVLLTLGPRTLSSADPRTPFSPRAFQGLLSCLAVMVLTDVQTLLTCTVSAIGDGRGYALPALCLCALLLALGGIYHLRMWGFLLNLIANLAILGLSLSRHFPGPLPVLLGGSAAVQILLPLPLWWSLVRRRPVSTQPSPVFAVVTNGVIALLWLSSLVAALAHLR